MFTFESTVRYSESDYRGKLNIYGILNYFQDCSTFQSESLGIGVKALHLKNLVWVISTWQIDVLRYPALGEKIVIGTFPYDYRGFFGKRNFIMKTSEGEVLAMADTLWTLLDYKKGTPEKVTPEISSCFTLEDKLPMEYVRGKIILNDAAQKKEEVVVKKSHLDANMHVNNGQYINMIMNDIESCDYKRLRVEYRKQVREGDIITPYIYESENAVTASIMDEGGNCCVSMEFIK